MKFINNILNEIKANYIYFYPLYEEFNKNYNINLLNLDLLEYKHFVPIVINYRLLNNNTIFGIIYQIEHYYTGNGKFKNQKKKN